VSPTCPIIVLMVPQAHRGSGSGPGYCAQIASLRTAERMGSFGQVAGMAQLTGWRRSLTNAALLHFDLQGGADHDVVVGPPNDRVEL